jgi:hypothetical protein
MSLALNVNLLILVELIVFFRCNVVVCVFVFGCGFVCEHGLEIVDVLF